MREEIGGAVGVRWTYACRNGARLKVAYCERALELGYLTQAFSGPNGIVFAANRAALPRGC